MDFSLDKAAPLQQSPFIEHTPLAVRMRPRTLEEYAGQHHILGYDAWLYKAIQYDCLSSIILYGPSGVGKTTLARIIARHTHGQFEEISALSATVKDVRTLITQAHNRLLAHNQKTIVFIDEIHRFSSSQQDVLLSAVEQRHIVLIGATTENPYFEVNSALISRCRVFELHTLETKEIVELLKAALIDIRGYQGRVTSDDETLEYLALKSGGDMRSAYNNLEFLVQDEFLNAPHVGEQLQLKYNEENLARIFTHSSKGFERRSIYKYDVTSAFIKSMRGSDVDAAIYYLACLLEGGEDPKYIARRILIFAAEDIGNADPRAVSVAHACFKACECIGMPECRINLAQATAYMALAPKSNTAYQAINKALLDVRKQPHRVIPHHIRDKNQHYSYEGTPYAYPHDYEGAWVNQQYLPDGLSAGCFYTPGTRGWEALAWNAYVERMNAHMQNIDTHKNS